MPRPSGLANLLGCVDSVVRFARPVPAMPGGAILLMRPAPIWLISRAPPRRILILRIALRKPEVTARPPDDALPTTVDS
jgi:hypothetical protein